MLIVGCVEIKHRLWKPYLKETGCEKMKPNKRLGDAKNQ